MNTWKGVIANLAVVDEMHARSPLAPVEFAPEPLYISPSGTRFFPLPPPKREPYPAAFEHILNTLLDVCWLCGTPYAGRDTAWFHVCWSGRLQCPFCRGTYRAVCDGGKWRVSDHGCRDLAPFLDEARRQQR